MGEKLGLPSSIVFGVDLQNLSLKTCYVHQIDEPQKRISTHETFFVETEQVHQKVFFEDLPKVIKGIRYFKTEEEAQRFVKIQIGL